MLTLDQLHKHWPHCPEEFAQGVVQTAPETFDRFEINTALRQAHFLAQCSHECGAGVELIESLTYTHAQRIMAVWPSRFPTYASAAPYVNNPQLLGDKVYNGRMGNRPGSGDGYNYRGRGPLNMTGADAYKQFGVVLSLPLVDKPELAIDPAYALLIAGAEWNASGCNKYADRDSVEEVSALINVGHLVISPAAIEGLSSRGAWLKVWKSEFNVT